MKTDFFFEQLLSLSHPYEITKVERKDLSVHIHISVSAEYHPMDSAGTLGIRHDTEARTWRHLDLFEYPCYLHCSVPKFKYKKGNDSYVETLKVPWGRPKSGFTLQFEHLAMYFLELHGCVSRVAKQLSEYPQRIQHLLDYYEPQEPLLMDEDLSENEKNKRVTLVPLEELKEKTVLNGNSLSSVRKLNIDETSRKKGKDYVTNFIDSESNKLLDVQKGKGAKTIERFVAKALSEGFQAEQITDISIDMSGAFICGCEYYFKEAAISFDKFHISQLINRCFDFFRKKQAKILGMAIPKWAIVKPLEKLTAKEHKEMGKVLDALPSLDSFHQHTNKFSAFWEFEVPEEGAAYLSFWIEKLKEMGEEFKEKKIITLANTLTKHFDNIVNVLKRNMDNAISEAFNNNVQVMKRVARGYKKFENYIQMIKVHCDLAR